MERAVNTAEKIKPLEGESFLSMRQLNEPAIMNLLEEAHAVEEYKKLVETDDSKSIFNRSKILDVVMRETSARIEASMLKAMTFLGGTGISSNIDKTSEAKGETITDSWLALATNSSVLGIRTPNNFGPHKADEILHKYHEYGKLKKLVPIINLGDGTNEHPTQALGDLLTMYEFMPEGKSFKDIKLTMVGDHERYRAFHSLVIGAQILDITVQLVESPHAKLPEEYQNFESGKLINYEMDLDSALEETDVLYIGRNPEEYAGLENKEFKRTRRLNRDYQKWHIDQQKIGLMPESSVILHPRPRGPEISPDIDFDPRVVDVAQMELSTNMRMAIMAQILGKSIKDKVSEC